MSILVGIDEAGLGPILGPLTVSSASFSMSSDLISCDLWQVLKNCIAPSRRHLAGRLLICDSKKAYSKSIGIVHLQRTTLSLLRCLGHQPELLGSLFKVISPDCRSRLSQYPWHVNCDSVPLIFDEPDIALSSNVFTSDSSSNKIQLLDLYNHCLDVGHYNHLIEKIQNKSVVVFNVICQLIKRNWDKFGRDDLQIIVDRQGGRSHYAELLSRIFPETTLTILKETSSISSYELIDSDKSMKIHFVVAGDKKFMPVALASMVSKYIRQLLMANINNYFVSHYSDLKPTAGYWQDGQRFIADIAEYLPKLKYNRSDFVRLK